MVSHRCTPPRWLPGIGSPWTVAAMFRRVNCKVRVTCGLYGCHGIFSRVNDTIVTSSRHVWSFPLPRHIFIRMNDMIRVASSRAQLFLIGQSMMFNCKKLNELCHVYDIMRSFEARELFLRILWFGVHYMCSHTLINHYCYIILWAEDKPARCILAVLSKKCYFVFSRNAHTSKTNNMMFVVLSLML